MVAQDRRVRRTRAILRQSLISLMYEKSIKQITVKELCEKADINRGTFYLHYNDVFDMLEKLEQDFFKELSRIIEGYTKEVTVIKKPLLEDLLTFILENKEFCGVLLSEQGDISFTRRLLEYLHDTLKHTYGNETLVAQHYYYYIMYGCIGLIENWLKTGATETPAEMAELSENIILNGAKQFIEVQ